MSYAAHAAQAAQHKYRPFRVPGEELTVRLRAVNDHDINALVDAFKNDLEYILEILTDEDGGFNADGLREYGSEIFDEVRMKVPALVDSLALVGSGYEIGTEEFEKEQAGLRTLSFNARKEICFEIVRRSVEAEGDLGKLLSVVRLGLQEAGLGLVMRWVDAGMATADPELIASFLGSSISVRT